MTNPYCYTEDEAQAMVKAGTDMIVAHVGLTTGGTIDATAAMTMDQAIDTTMRIADASRKIRKDILVICHGGPFHEPENVAEAMKRMPGINGFYGATSMERLPVERGIKEQVSKFNSMKLAG